MKISDSHPESQAHCLVAHANTQPKPAKELVLPAHGETEKKHETLTINIGHLADSVKCEMSTINKIYSGLKRLEL